MDTQVKESAVNTKTLDKLAKLLAAEDITIEHNPTFKTASFDLKNRVLRLPVWKDMSTELYHMLVLHEVSHAVNTPRDEWMRQIEIHGRYFGGFLNIIEDARIERKIKVKFPGSRRDFFEAYKDLANRDFFGANKTDINKMSLINRINLYFKIGPFTSIPFSDEEQHFVTAVEKTTTFDEAVAVAFDLYMNAKKPGSYKDAELEDLDFDTVSDDFDFDDDSDDSDSSESAESKESDENAEIDSGKTQENNSKTENREEKIEDLSDSSRLPDQDPSDDSDDIDDHQNEFDTSTYENLIEEIEKKLVDTSAIPKTYINLDTSSDYRDYIVDYSKIIDMIIKDIDDHHGGASPLYHTASLERYNAFRSKNSKVIGYMAKEFEMRKAADQYLRARTAKTGVISPNKLHSYKFSEDIFRRLTVLPGAKNHGMIMLVDFSGSMEFQMKNTIHQLVNLVMFCRKINIPHRVYAFTDAYPIGVLHELNEKNNNNNDRSISAATAAEMNGFIPGTFCLLELFSEKMRPNVFAKMAGYLLDFGESFSFNRGKGYSAMLYNRIPNMSRVFRLGGTPLNSSLMLMPNLINDFRKETRTQIINTIVLTDGESACLHSIIHYGFSQRNIVGRDPVTKMQCDISNRSDETKFLVEVLRNRTECNVVCFRIDTRRVIEKIIKDDVNDFTKYPAVVRKFRENRFYNHKQFMGFDDFFYISSDSLDVEDSVLGENFNGITKGRLARAFITANKKRGVSRVLLSDFIRRIAA
jgi:hypothetical protein